MTKDPSQAPAKPVYLEIYFEKGIPKKLNGKELRGIALLAKLNQIGGANGIGRSDMIENRLVGIKSREIYEAPAAYILHEAHKALES
ncbi:argininosuccinate synthase, partial [Candidatus Berkelbacteria bacterium CG_4_9_14_3_um_filter_33_5]